MEQIQDAAKMPAGPQLAAQDPSLRIPDPGDLMAKKATVFLTPRTLSALRQDEGLSARLNTIVDRYLALTVDGRAALMRRFTDAEWNMVREAYEVIHGEGENQVPASSFRKAIADSLREVERRRGANSELSTRVEMVLSPADIIVMFDLLESLHLSDVAGNRKAP